MCVCVYTYIHTYAHTHTYNRIFDAENIEILKDTCPADLKYKHVYMYVLCRYIHTYIHTYNRFFDAENNEILKDTCPADLNMEEEELIEARQGGGSIYEHVFACVCGWVCECVCFVYEKKKKS